MENSYLMISRQGSAMGEFRLPAIASRPGRTRIVEPNHARVAQPIVNPMAWPSAGVMPVERPAAQQHQGGALAGFGTCDVTDTKFSTRVGPPPCRPPV